MATSASGRPGRNADSGRGASVRIAFMSETSLGFS
jgi:hypothetical protein